MFTHPCVSSLLQYKLWRPGITDLLTEYPKAADQGHAHQGHSVNSWLFLRGPGYKTNQRRTALVVGNMNSKSLPPSLQDLHGITCSKENFENFWHLFWHGKPVWSYKVLCHVSPKGLAKPFAHSRCPDGRLEKVWGEGEKIPGLDPCCHSSLSSTITTQQSLACLPSLHTKWL